MKYRVLAIDMDGTLLDESREISRENINAIQEYRNLGGHVIVCSGRSPLSTRWLAEYIGLSEPIIAYNGAVIQNYDGEIRSTLHFKQNDLKRLAAYCEENGLYLQLYEGDQLIVSERNNRNEHWIEHNILALEQSGASKERCDYYRSQCAVQHTESLSTYLDKNKPNISKAAIFAEREKTMKCAGDLHEERLGIHISSSLNYANLEISPENGTKEYALRKVVEELGFTLSEAAAIGDNYNDLGMLKAAGLGIAMGNAPEEVKEAANLSTQTNDEAGVAFAIQNYILK
ncbi:HAD family hydrolase [Cytobacillus gottheilii]|uniref:HAD family hydrolase n=1 Tax=Cytobacillus gottheilii TaxID=859144 RepID=UPI001593748F|nr:HAD family hydrolase [Cytobacillus gottheilii]